MPHAELAVFLGEWTLEPDGIAIVGYDAGRSETSRDEGATWELDFDLTYRRVG
jgi:hypothetical protein